MLEALLRRAATAQHAHALTALEVHASDAPVALSGQGGAVRVLLVGSGITSGWGVHTHGLALVGSLQRELQSRLGRAVDVEQVSSLGAVLADAPDVLGARATEEWDAIVVAFGLSDAMRLTSAADWSEALGRLMAKLDGDMPQGFPVPILVVGVPPIASVGGLRVLTPLRAFVGRHGERLNAVTRAAVARNRRAAFVPLPAMTNNARRPAGSPEAYRAWAAVLAAELQGLLPTGVVRVDAGAMELQPLGGLTADVLAPQHAEVREQLQDVVLAVRSRFGADLVLLNLLNGDRLWNVADSSGSALRAVDRSQTLCSTTLQQGFLHVPDLAGEARFAALRAVAPGGIASYAGIALRGDDGAVVGTLCLFNGGTSGPVDRTALGRFGAAAEARLAGLGATAPRAENVERAPRAEADPPRHLHLVQEPDTSGRTPTAPTTPDVSDALTRSKLTGALDRQVRLRTEGRQLTRFAEVKGVPPGADTHVAGTDPIRVLLVGGEYSIGFGARTRSEALDGALARLLHTRTGRGVIVENRAEYQVRLPQLAASLGSTGAHTFHLVVWTPTFNEAAKLLLRSRWVTGIEAMLHRIETTSQASVVLVGFPSLLGSQPLAVIGRARAAQINRILHRIAARHPRVLVAEPPPIVLSEVERTDGPETYRDAAVRILPVAMDLLDPQRPMSSDPSTALVGATD